MINSESMNSLAFIFRIQEELGRNITLYFRPFKKYRFEGEINENTISKFINDFKESKLKPFYKSQ